MKVLVTGASGFLGRYFLEYLILQGEHDIWSVDKVPHPDGIPIVVEDMVSFLDDFDEDVDLVIHMAGPVGGRVVIEQDPMFNADALRLDSALFRWAAKHATKVVYPSSSAVYPVDDQAYGMAVPQTEGSFHPDHGQWSRPDEMYGFTKLAGEVLAWTATRYGVSTLVIRPFSGYGPGQSFDYPVPSIVRRAVMRENPIAIWGPPTTQRDFIYVTDIVKMTMALVQQDWTGYRTVNLGNGQPIDFATVARVAAQIVGYEPEIEHDLNKPKGVDQRWADTERMQRMLIRAGYEEEPVGLRWGLTQVVEWVRKGLLA